MSSDFAAYKKSTGCTCDRGEGEMHTEACPLYPQMTAAMDEQERQRKEWLKGNGIEDDLMSGLKRLADRDAFLNTDTAKPRGDLIIEDIGPKA